MNWFFWAFLSACFAALTAILAKVGVENINSNLATAIRTTVILVFTWGIAFATGGAPPLISDGMMKCAMSDIPTPAFCNAAFTALGMSLP